MRLWNQLRRYVPSRSFSLHRYEPLRAPADIPLPNDAANDWDPEGTAGSEYEPKQTEVSIHDAEEPEPIFWTTLLKHLAWQLALVLVPSFLRRFIDEEYTRPTRKITETSYLRGVRGLAVVFVYFQSLGHAHWIYNGYTTNSHIIQLPFIRLLYSSRFMVALSFTISGYTISYRPLQLSRSTDHTTTFTRLASALFRRTPRLFLPLIPVMIITATITYYGCWDDEDFSSKHCAYPANSWWQQQSWAFIKITRMLDPSDWKEFYPDGTPHLWIIPMEWKNSMVVYLTLLFFGNVKPIFRTGFLVIIAWYLLDRGRWDTFLFVFGMILADIRIWRKMSPYSLESWGASPKGTFYVRIANVIWWSNIFTLGLFLGSWPASLASTSRWYSTLCHYTPARYANDEVSQNYFWIAIASLLIFCAFENLEVLQRPFTSEFMAYMGDISFAFYLVQWGMAFTLGTVLIRGGMKMMPWGNVDYPVGFFVGAGVLTPFVVWAADLEWRLFDEGAKRVSEWLYGLCVRDVVVEEGPTLG